MTKGAQQISNKWHQINGDPQIVLQIFQNNDFQEAKQAQ